MGEARARVQGKGVEGQTEPKDEASAEKKLPNEKINNSTLVKFINKSSQIKFLLKC